VKKRAVAPPNSDLRCFTFCRGFVWRLVVPQLHHRNPLPTPPGKKYQNLQLAKKLEQERQTSATWGHRYRDTKSQLDSSQQMALQASATLGATQKDRSLNLTSCQTGKFGGGYSQALDLSGYASSLRSGNNKSRCSTPSISTRPHTSALRPGNNKSRCITPGTSTRPQTVGHLETTGVREGGRESHDLLTKLVPQTRKWLTASKSNPQLAVASDQHHSSVASSPPMQEAHPLSNPHVDAIAASPFTRQRSPSPGSRLSSPPVLPTPSGKLAANSRLMKAQAKIYHMQAEGSLASKTPPSTKGTRRLRSESVKKTTGSLYVGSGLGMKKSKIQLKKTAPPPVVPIPPMSLDDDDDLPQALPAVAEGGE